MLESKRTHFQERVDLLEQLSSGGIDSKNMSKVIRALSFCLTELSPGYHYNESYLNNTSDLLIEVLTTFKTKRGIVEGPLKKAIQKNLMGTELVFVVDDIWQIKMPKYEIDIYPNGDLSYSNKKTLLIKVFCPYIDGEEVFDTCLIELDSIKLDEQNTSLENALKPIFESCARWKGRDDGNQRDRAI